VAFGPLFLSKNALNAQEESVAMTALFRSNRDRIVPALPHAGIDVDQLERLEISELQALVRDAKDELNKRKTMSTQRLNHDLKALAERAGLTPEEYQVLFS